MQRLLLLSILLIVQLGLPCSAENQLPVPYSGSYALLIGESKYERGWPSLPSVPEEAEQLGKQLEKLGFHVSKAFDLSGSELRMRVTAFIKEFGYAENNRLLLFFSGHGESRNGGERGYFVPADSPLKGALPRQRVERKQRCAEDEHHRGKMKEA